MRSLLKILLLVTVIWLAAIPSYSQSGYTQVTATVKDANGTKYSNAPYVVTFFDPGTSGKLPLLSGSTFQQSYNGISTDGNGVLSIALPDNGIIASTSGAANTQWTFSICTAVGAFTTQFCIPSVKITITGANQDISSILTPIAPILPTGGGGSANPGGSNTQLQFNNNSTFGGAAGITTPDGNSIDVKGPIPYVDIISYGARPLATNLGNLSQTGSISSGSQTLTLSNSGQYQNGDTVNITGAGSGNSVGTSAPSAPTVTPSIASGPLNSGEVANSALGSSTYSYEIMWCDLVTKACTPPSSATTITNGQATLGRITTNITSISRSGTVATVTTASAHNFNLGSCNQTSCAEVQVWKGSDPSFTGFSRITGTPADNTHFAYTTPGSTTYGATTSSTGGQFQYFQGNHINCGAAPLSTAICVVYGRQVGSFVYIGSGRMDESFWDDWGTTISGNPLQPGFVPGAPPATFQNNALSTTISGGAGTTTVTLAASASTSVASQYVTIDQCPILQSAATVAQLNNSQVYIPPTGTNLTQKAFVIGSYCPLASGTSVRQAGNILLTSPIVLQGNNVSWIGNRNSAGDTIYVLNTVPGIYLSSSVGNAIFDGLSILGQNVNNGLLILSDQAVKTVTKNYSFTVGNSVSGQDYLGMAEVIRGNGFDNQWDDGFMDGNYTNGGSNLGDTTAPNLGFFSVGGGPGAFIRNLLTNAKGIAQTGNLQMDISMDHVHIQGAVQPTYTTDSTTSDAASTFDHIVNDSTAAPIFTPLNGYLGAAKFYFVSNSADTNGFPPITSGGTISDAEVILQGPHPFGQNFNVRLAMGTNFGIWPYRYIPDIIPSGNPSNIGFENLISPSSATISAGGTLTLVQHCWTLSTIFPSGLEGAISGQQCLTPTTGNQTGNISWTVIPGLSYNIYRDGFRNNNSALTSSPYIDNGSSGPGQGSPLFSSDGYPHIGTDGFLGAIHGCYETTAPSGKNNWDYLWCDSTAHSWKINPNNTGAATLPSFVITPTAGDCVTWSNGTGQLGDFGSACGLAFQNGGSPLAAGTTLNCSTNTTCTSSSGVITITATNTAATAFSAITAATNSNSGTFTATGNSWDFTGSTIFKLRVGAALTASANGDIGYDTTNTNWHLWNGADRILAPLASGFTTGHCGQPTTTGNKWEIVDSGAPCGNNLSIQTNGVANTSQAILNYITSTVNSTGLIATPSNPATGNEKIEISGTVNVASGGTGLSSPAAHTVPVAEGPGNFTLATPTANSQCLMSAAANFGTTDPSFQTCPSGFTNPMNTLGDMIAENSTPAPARVPGPVGPNGVPQILIDTAASGAATFPLWALPGVPVNNNGETTCSSYTLNVLDRATNVRCSGGTTATVTFPVHTTLGLASNYPVDFTNLNSGTLTLTVTTPDIIDGSGAGGSQTVLTNWEARVRQDSSGNWYTTRVPTFATFGSSCANGLTWSTTTSFGCLGALPIQTGGAAGGDLGATYPNPTVLALHFGSTQIVTTSTAPTNGQCLEYNGTGITGAACSGGSTPCTTTALSVQYNNAGAFGCVPDVTFSTPHTLLFGASGILDLSATSVTAGFKLPSAAGAAPTSDSFLSFNTTTHAMVWGSNSTTIVGAAAATGTNSSTSCTNQFFTVISATAAPTCTTATLASAQFANQGTTTTLLHGNAAGNPSFSAVALGTDVTGTLPNGDESTNTVTATSAAAAANQVCQSGGATKTCVYNDSRDVKIIPFCVSPGGTASPGVTYASSQWTPVNRAGTNNIGCALQAIPSTGATLQFLIELPKDWDSNTQPYINIVYGSGANTSGTVIWTVSSACMGPGDGSVTDDPAFVAESAFASQTMAVANRAWAKSGEFTAITSGNNCTSNPANALAILFKVVLSGTAASAINAYQAILTIPTRPVIQGE